MSATDAAAQGPKRGAGVIPFAVRANTVHFLLQKTFSGRKTGFLIDFGGGLGPDEDFRQAAVREFVEETETLYFCEDITRARRSVETVRDQIPIVEALFDKTLTASPDSWCRRAPGNPLRPKSWKTFFIEFPYRDIGPLNREWESDRSGRFKKRRELVWLATDELLGIFTSTPDRLWKRVRQLENAAQLVRSIQQDRGA